MIEEITNIYDKSSFSNSMASCYKQIICVNYEETLFFKSKNLYKITKKTYHKIPKRVAKNVTKAHCNR